MARTGRLSASSRLAAPAARVWAECTAAEGINYELMPIVRMTIPGGASTLSVSDVSDGEHVGRSWLLLGGFLPFDYDDITIERIEPGRAFQEDSTMLSQRSWRHHRAVEPIGESACTVTDTIEFVPRLPLPIRLLEFTFGQTFAHRHRRLRKRYGQA
jgi:hypothetical protein